jgi:hypothetical protein
MLKMVKEICEKYQQATGKRAKKFKKEGKMIDIDSYRSIVGKIMYYATKIAPHICNAVRELACQLSNPGEEHWKALERCVGYLGRLSDLKMSQNTGINL